jgi:hypothetical protein
MADNPRVEIHMRARWSVAALAVAIAIGLPSSGRMITAAEPSATPGARPQPLGVRPNPFGTILGNALNSTNGALPNNMVRLRDARAGRIVETATTDKSGLFEFRTIDPGSYVVELVGNDHTILSASQILSVNAGQAISAVVKLPFHLSPMSGLLGHTVPSAAAVSSAAASSGIMAAKVAGEPISPQ